VRRKRACIFLIGLSLTTLRFAPTLTGAYNMAYLVRAISSPKLPSVTSDMPKTLYAMLAHYYLTIGLKRDECS